MTSARPEIGSSPGEDPTMNSRAQVRARHLKSLIAAIDDRMASANLVRSRVEPAFLAATDCASNIDWLPFELDLAVTRAHQSVSSR